MAGSNGITLGGISCYNCGHFGHMQEFCPSPPAADAASITSGLTLTQYAYMLAQSWDGDHGIDPD